MLAILARKRSRDYYSCKINCNNNNDTRDTCLVDVILRRSILYILNR